jgi:mandelonitrile lyase
MNGTRKIGDLLRSRSMEDLKFREWLGGQDFRYVGLALPIYQSNDWLMREFCRRIVSTIDIPKSSIEIRSMD